MTPRRRTADWGYVRFHWGLSSPQPCYAAPTLAARARVLRDAWPGETDVHVYFNNDSRCCAVRDAVLFAVACRRLGEEVTRVPARSDVRVVI